MRLPASLAHWSPYLSMFGGNLPFTLAPTVQCLERVIGPSESIVTSYTDEPEGYDGIARRGSYERLLLSEWLFADEYPEEFLRRSSVGEHAFLELARKSPTGQRKVTVLFDCGPNQFGSPRIAHIAVLIMLARRVDKSGMTLDWGVLQDPDMESVEGATRESIEKLLEQRRIKEVTKENLDEWKDRFDGSLRQVFLVGGSRLSRLLGRERVARLEIDDILEPGESALSAFYTAAQGKIVRFRLPLPKQTESVRLLTRPFARASGVRVSRIDPEDSDQRNWSIIASGSDHFMLRNTADTIVSISIPRHVNQLPRQRIYSTRDYQPLIAAGARVAGYAAAVLSVRDVDNLCLTMFGGRTGGGYREHLFQIAGLPSISLSDTSLATLFNEPAQTGHSTSLWMLLADKIVSIPTDENDKQGRIVAEDVLALASARARIDQIWQDVVIYAQRSFDDTKVHMIGLDSGGQMDVTISGQVSDLLIGPGSATEPLIAYRRGSNSHWNFIDSGEQIIVKSGLVDGTVLGVTGMSLSNAEPSLLVIHEHQAAPYLAGARDVELPPVPRMVRDAAINPDGVIGYIADGGMLTVYWPGGDWQCYLAEGHRFQLLSSSLEPMGLEEEQW